MKSSSKKISVALFLVVLLLSLAAATNLENIEDITPLNSQIDVNGSLDLQSNRIEDLANPDSGDDAMPRSYADTRYLERSGDYMTGDLGLNGYDINNIGSRGNYIDIGDPTGVNGIADSNFSGIDIAWDTDNAFIGLRNYGSDRKDVVISNEQSADNIRIQSDGNDRFVVDGGGGATLYGGALNLNGNNINSIGNLGGTGIVNSDNINSGAVSSSELASNAVTSAGGELDSSVAGNQITYNSGTLGVNEGSGSGLNADMVDGYHANDLSRPKNSASFTSTNTSTDINQGSWTTIPWNAQLDVDAGYTHDPSGSPGQITFDNGGTYRVHTMLSYNVGNYRVNPGIKFSINGNKRSRLGLSGYTRDATGHNEASNYLTEQITVNAGDTLRVETYQYGNSGTVNLRSEESLLLIEQVSKTVPMSGDADTVDGYHAADFLLSGGDTMTGNLDMGGNAITNADWSDANDLNSGGGISDFSNAGDLNSGGSINDFSAANDLDGSGNINDFSAAGDLGSSGDILDGNVENAELANSGITVNGGTDILGGSANLGGSLIVDHADTSSQGNVATGGSTVIDDIDLDGRGHLTNMNTENRRISDWNTANSNIDMGSNNIDNVGYVDTNRIDVWDQRDDGYNSGDDPKPNYWGGKRAGTIFTQGFDRYSDWASGFTVQGWNADSYVTWQLIGDSSGSMDSGDDEWYLRRGMNDTWETSRKIITDDGAGNVNIDSGNLDVSGQLSVGSTNCGTNEYIGGDGSCKTDNTGTDSQDLSNTLDTSPSVGYVEHDIQISGGTNTVARDYYDPNTDNQLSEDTVEQYIFDTGDNNQGNLGLNGNNILNGAICPDGTCDSNNYETFDSNGLGTSNIYDGSGGEIDIQSQINFNGNNVKNFDFGSGNDLDASGNLVSGSVSDNEIADNTVDNSEIQNGVSFTFNGITNNGNLNMGDNRVSFSDTSITEQAGDHLVLQGRDPDQHLNLTNSGSLVYTEYTSSANNVFEVDSTGSGNGAVRLGQDGSTVTLDMNSNTISEVAAPADSNDAAPRSWINNNDDTIADDQTLSTTADVTGTNDQITISEGNSIEIDDDYDPNTDASTKCGSDEVLEGGDTCVSNYEAGDDGDSSSTNERQGISASGDTITIYQTTSESTSVDSASITDDTIADDQNLGYSNDNAPTGSYATHTVTIDNGNNAGIRDYYDPNTNTQLDDQAATANVDMSGNSITNIDEVRGSTSYTDIYSSTDGRVLLRAKGAGGELGMYDDYNGRWVARSYNGGDLDLNPSGDVHVTSGGFRLPTGTDAY